MKTKALAPWFGSNRMLGEHVGVLLAGCEWVGVPFAGGMCELPYIDARTIVVNDLHRHVINLARVAAHPVFGPRLYRRLRREAFHPDVLAIAQDVASRYRGDYFNENAAFHYFVAVWMTRSGLAGTKRELDGNLALRWDAGGGDSAVRYQSAVRSLVAWRRVLARCTFSVLDVFEFIDMVKDRPRHGLYLDPPFPETGDRYCHTLTLEQHAHLAKRLRAFKDCRVVCRFYDTPFVRLHYGNWGWHQLTGRKSSNAAAPEVLLFRGG